MAHLIDSLAGLLALVTPRYVNGIVASLTERGSIDCRVLRAAVVSLETQIGTHTEGVLVVIDDILVQIASLNCLPLTLAAEELAVSTVVIDNLQQTIGIALTRHIYLSACILQHRSKVSVDVTRRRDILNGRVATSTLELPTVQSGLIEPTVACPRCNRTAAQTLVISGTIEFTYDLVVCLNLTTRYVSNEIGKRTIENGQIHRHFSILSAERVAQFSLDSSDGLRKNGCLLDVLIEFYDHAAVNKISIIDTECRELSVLQQFLCCRTIRLSGNELHSNYGRQHQECFSHCDYRFLLVIIKLVAKLLAQRHNLTIQIYNFFAKYQ